LVKESASQLPESVAMREIALVHDAVRAQDMTPARRSGDVHNFAL